jgi:hypothetical protein
MRHPEASSIVNQTARQEQLSYHRGELPQLPIGYRAERRFVAEIRKKLRHEVRHVTNFLRIQRGSGRLPAGTAGKSRESHDFASKCGIAANSVTRQCGKSYKLR